MAGVTTFTVVSAVGAVRPRAVAMALIRLVTAALLIAPNVVVLLVGAVTAFPLTSTVRRVVVGVVPVVLSRTV